MIQYQMQYNDDEIVPCDSCGCAAPTAGFDWPPNQRAGQDRPQRMLCRFCSTTLAGRYTETPTPDPWHSMRAEVWRAAAAVYNLLQYPDSVVTP